MEKLYFYGYLTEGFENTIEKHSQDFKGFFPNFINILSLLFKYGNIQNI